MNDNPCESAAEQIRREGCDECGSKEHLAVRDFGMVCQNPHGNPGDRAEVVFCGRTWTVADLGDLADRLADAERDR